MANLICSGAGRIGRLIIIVYNYILEREAIKNGFPFLFIYFEVL